MLPATARLTHHTEFASVVRRGRRAGRHLLVVYVAALPGARGPRVGFIVSRAVGGSVVRHRVVRRLRGVMRHRLAGLPEDLGVVIRALPAAANADSTELARDLDAGLRAALRKLAGVPR